MSFRWSDRSIEWFLSASVYTGFHKALAETILPFLDPTDTLGDLGCGLGRIDLELAPHLAHITALDIDPRVTRRLEQDAAARGLRNIRVLCADVQGADLAADILFLSFFGRAWLEFYLHRCRKRLIRVVNADNTGNLYPSRHRHTKKTTIACARQELEELGFPYRLLECALEFGQPLRSPEEGLAFVRSHAPEATDSELRAFLSGHAVETGREDFPLYIPNRKRIGIFVIESHA